MTAIVFTYFRRNIKCNTNSKSVSFKSGAIFFEMPEKDIQHLGNKNNETRIK